MSRLTNRNSGIGDLRGFKYQLEPLVKRAQWELDNLHGQLAKVQQQLAVMRNGLDVTVDLHDLESAGLARQILVRLDSMNYQAGLLYLAQLQSSIKKSERQIQELDKTRHQLLLSCQACEARLEGLGSHEAGAINAYVLEKSRFHATEADRDWIMREALNLPSRNFLPDDGGAT